jgi:hypothetical protein
MDLKARWRFRHSYRSGFWGLAYGFERVNSGDQWFIHFRRKVWVFYRLPKESSSDDHS